ncbi:MAG: DUF4395 domain-containing protein [Actinomycetota bacterium]|jgi:hypothetical protein|nr:DUF4395 domain-containing protein [Actinomycetota bacterium]
MADLFRFPDPVDEHAARTVATGVVVLALAAIASRQGWLLVLLAAGFWARVLTGPTLSPLGQLATRIVAPRFGSPRPVPGPPKRFAQAIGCTFSSTAVVLWFAADAHLAALAVVGALTVAAALEAGLGYCLGCQAYALLMRVGAIPASACPECAELTRRHPDLAAGS